MEDLHTKTPAQDNPIMYLIVRKSLGMSIGKACAQTAHASQLLMQKREQVLLDHVAAAHDNPDARKLFDKICIFNSWLNTAYGKVVLGASETEWLKLKALFPEEERVIVVDLGLTEIKSGTETVMGLLPMKKSDRPKLLTKLQLLK